MIKRKIDFGGGHYLVCVFRDEEEVSNYPIPDFIVGAHVEAGKGRCASFVDKLPTHENLYTLRCRGCGWTIVIPKRVDTWRRLAAFAFVLRKNTNPLALGNSNG